MESDLAELETAATSTTAADRMMEGASFKEEEANVTDSTSLLENQAPPVVEAALSVTNPIEVEKNGGSVATPTTTASSSSSTTELLLFRNVSNGFRAIKVRRDQGPSDAIIELDDKPQYLSQVLIHILDPSSAPSSVISISPSKKSQSSSSTLSSPQAPSSSLQLHEKLLHILNAQHQSKLRHVPYQSPRTGSSNVIESLTVETIVTKSQGASLMDGHLGGGGGDVNDPSEWHRLPYCHVYLVTCETLEQYRTKVKPSIQVFLSQIEATTTSSGTHSNNSSAHGGNHPHNATSSNFTTPSGISSQYVLVFVPNTNKSTSSSSEDGINTAATSSTTSTSFAPRARISHFASRVAAARQMARETITASVSGSTNASTIDGSDGGVMGDLSSDDGGGGGGNSTTTGLNDSLSNGSGGATTGISSSTSSGGAATTAHLSKLDKELARRLAVDFPNGNVCVLSSLYHYLDNNNDDNSTTNQEYWRDVQQAEWKHFSTKLGTAIASGFKERCQRYIELLKQLELLRTLAQQDNVEAKVQILRHRQKRLDMAYYFLVKESWAFTYEQLNLPSEALLLYDELKAVVPELHDASASTNAPIVDRTLSNVALLGDTEQFRAKLRGTLSDLTPMAPALHEYIFARVTSLLFEMDKSVEVVSRCLAYIQSMYHFRLQHWTQQQHKRDGSKDDHVTNRADDSNKDRDRLDIETWAFDFCWDIKRACDIYLADDVSESSAAAVADAFDTGFRPDSSQQHRKSSIHKKRTRRVDEVLAKAICDLIEFARLRLLTIGDLVLGGKEKNPVRTVERTAHRELDQPWLPWKPGTSEQEESQTEEEPDDDDDIDGEGAGFLALAMSSPGAFVSNYLALLQVLEAHNRFSGRRRCASRFCIEIAGLHISRGDTSKAAAALRVAAKSYADDGWESCHFGLLFRLAGYQRQVATADEYLQTLVQCFGPNKSHAAAPPKALDALLADMETLLRSSWVSRKRLTSIPIFDPIMGLESFLPTAARGSSRDLLKKVYSMGEKAVVAVSVQSFLPNDIEVDSISVDLVPFQVYVSAMEDSTNVKDNDLFTVLNLKGPVKLIPGWNEFSINWIPMVVGQFVLGRTNITWKSIRFSYAAEELKRPVMRIDVLPSAPTHSASLIPNYLLPGQEQTVKLLFCVGTDIVRAANVCFACAPGLRLMQDPKSKGAVETDDWKSSLELELPNCAMGETVSIDLLVKCSSVEQSASNVGSHSLHAQVRTSYRPPFPTDADVTTEEQQYADENMAEHQIEAAVSTLSSQALTIESLELMPYWSDRLLVDVCVKCNIPATFVLRRWEISLPSFLALSTDHETHDLNSCLLNALVTSGELINLSFHCQVVPTSENAFTSHLLMVIEDEFGRSYNEILPLNLRRPAAAVAGRTSLPQANHDVSILLEPSDCIGMAGQPIRLSYQLKRNDLKGLGCIVRYQLVYDAVDWVISGPVEGIVSSTTSAVDQEQKPPYIDVTLVAIPTRPGVIVNYPQLRLSGCLSSSIAGKDALPLSFNTVLDNVTVEVDPSKASFQSVVHPLHTAVACPFASIPRSSQAFVAPRP